MQARSGREPYELLRDLDERPPDEIVDEHMVEQLDRLGRKALRTPEHIGSVHTAAFSHDGRFFATGRGDAKSKRAAVSTSDTIASRSEKAILADAQRDPSDNGATVRVFCVPSSVDDWRGDGRLEMREALHLFDSRTDLAVNVLRFGSLCDGTPVLVTGHGSTSTRSKAACDATGRGGQLRVYLLPSGESASASGAAGGSSVDATASLAPLVEHESSRPVFSLELLDTSTASSARGERERDEWLCLVGTGPQVPSNASAAAGGGESSSRLEIEMHKLTFIHGTAVGALGGGEDDGAHGLLGGDGAHGGDGGGGAEGAATGGGNGVKSAPPWEVRHDASIYSLVIDDVEANGAEVRAVAASPDGGTFAVGGTFASIRTYRSATGRVRRRMASGSPCELHYMQWVNAIAFCPSRRGPAEEVLAAGGYDNSVQLFHVESGASLFTCARTHTHRPRPRPPFIQTTARCQSRPTPHASEQCQQ